MSKRSEYFKKKAREENNLFESLQQAHDEGMEKLIERHEKEDERRAMAFDPEWGSLDFENEDGLEELLDYDGVDVKFDPRESNVAHDDGFVDWLHNGSDAPVDETTSQINALCFDRDVYRGRASTLRQTADTLRTINRTFQRQITALLREHPAGNLKAGMFAHRGSGEDDPLERIPPHNIDAENAVLGNYIVDSTKMVGWNQKYVNLMFYRPAHVLLHSAMLQLDQQFDYTTLLSHLERTRSCEQVGGRDTVQRMYDEAKADPLSHRIIQEYLEIIERHYLERQALLFAGKLMFEVNHNEYEDGEGFDRKTHKIDSMPDYIRMRAKTFCDLIPFRLRSQDDMDAIVQAVDAQFKAVLARKGAPEISTGYHSLDKVTHGVRGGRLVVVGGRPKIGKTTFCANIVYNLAERGIGTILFTYESTKEEVVQKLIARRGKIDTENFEVFEKTEDEQAALVQSYEEAKDYVMRMPIWVNHERPDVDNVLGRVAELKLKYPSIKMVVIDGIQSFAGYAPYQNNKSDIYYELLKKFRAEIGTKYNVAVFVTSQLKGVVEKRKGKRPLSVDDFSDCKGLAEVADNALALYRPGFYWPEAPEFKLADGNDWMSVIPIALRVGDTRKAVRLGFTLKTATVYEPENGAYDSSKAAGTDAPDKKPEAK